jgi:hypothetical protein
MSEMPKVELHTFFTAVNEVEKNYSNLDRCCDLAVLAAMSELKMKILIAAGLLPKVDKLSK